MINFRSNYDKIQTFSTLPKMSNGIYRSLTLCLVLLELGKRDLKKRELDKK